MRIAMRWLTDKLYFTIPIILVLVVNLLFSAFIMDDGIVMVSAGSLSINIILTSIVAFLFGYILWIVIRNKHQPTNNLSLFPASIVIPVYNEENNIYDVLSSILKTDYPLDLLEFIVINDGSTDNSLKEIERFNKSNQYNLRLISFEQNKGKKEGLIAGFKAATNEIILTIDSDTFLEKDSIRNLLAHFENDVSAVCGYTDVKNYDHNIITKIQKYEYLISHQLFKAFEAHYNGVLCCPGCFSAYRKSDILEVLDKFQASKIWNFKVDYGEDRFLTALLLNKNKKIKYAHSAKAWTIVPNNIKSFVIQRKRWIKSWFINSLFLFRIVWKKAFPYQLYFYLSFIFNILIISVPVIMVFFIVQNQFYFLIHCTYIILLYILFSLFMEKKLNLSMPVMFYLFTIIIYFWLVPLAIANVNDESWGKRAH